ncbi:MAG: AtpZ/AtpI family protein [Actinobacteria bacterium]|nr:AtpZ/AtpI family protein [Actinomycetota bacterium]
MSAALLVCGGLGWLIDLAVGTTKVFMPIGMVGGAAAGTYLVYLKYGKEKSAKG